MVKGEVQPSKLCKSLMVCELCEKDCRIEGLEGRLSAITEHYKKIPEILKGSKWCVQLGVLVKNGNKCPKCKGAGTWWDSKNAFPCGLCKGEGVLLNPKELDQKEAKK